MDTEKKFGIKKDKAILLFIQMIVIVLLSLSSIYIMVFLIINQFGAWMITAYAFVMVAVVAIILYGVFGFRKGEWAYLLAIVPFLGAIFVNILFRSARGTGTLDDILEIALLTILFALTFAFLLKQKDNKFSYTIAYSMVLVSLIFSFYGAITANIGYVKSVSDKWATYLAMYLSIFTPTIMSVTILLTYYVRNTKTQVEQ